MYDIACVWNRIDNSYSFVDKHGYLDCSVIKDVIRVETVYVKSHHLDLWNDLLRHLDGLALRLELPIMAIIDIDESEYYLHNQYRLFERQDGKTLVTKSLRDMKPMMFDIFEDDESISLGCCM